MDKKEYNKIWREKNKEKIRAYNASYQKEYREKNKEQIKNKRKLYCEKHREELREKSLKYASEHREEACERARRYYVNNKESVLVKNKEYRSRKEVKDRINELSNRNYYKSIEMLDTKMYQLPEGAVILDEKHISYDNITFVIHKRGYLRYYGDTLHVYLMKKLGKWFDGCEVHHIDGNALNNTIGNLICLTKEQHTEAHRLMRKSKENYLIWLNNTRSD